MKKKIKTILTDISKKNVALRRLIRSSKTLLKRLKYLYYFLRYRVDQKTVIFEVYGGRNYCCSPKYIYEKMLELEEFKNFTFIWAFKDPASHEIKQDERTKILKSGSKEYLKYMSISKYWIVNSIVDESIIKKKTQVYVQCWHGTPLKRLRYDIEVDGSVLNTIKEIRKRNDIDAKRFDYFLSPSAYCTEKFTSAFNLEKLHKNDIIIEEGYPRNELLFTFTKKEVDAIKDKLHLPKDKKVMLYFPTFRDNQHTSGLGYTYNLEIDFDSLKKKFERDYVILFRPHYFIANKIDLSNYKGFVYDVSKYDEINDLYIISDLLITDYSSVFFDYANLKRPMIFYMYDYDLYQSKLRDFYISLDELPGPIVKTQGDLESEIKNIDKELARYRDKYELFNKKYNYLDDRDASSRVIKRIFKELF